MKVTFLCDEELIREVQRLAGSNAKTLSEALRIALNEYACQYWLKEHLDERAKLQDKSV